MNENEKRCAIVVSGRQSGKTLALRVAQTMAAHIDLADQQVVGPTICALGASYSTGDTVRVRSPDGDALYRVTEQGDLAHEGNRHQRRKAQALHRKQRHD